MGLVRELLGVMELRTRENDSQIAALKRKMSAQASVIIALEERVQIDSARIDALERALSRK
jgi:hypothetical protein